MAIRFASLVQGLPADSSHIQSRIPEAEKVRELKSAAEFSYLDAADSISWWDHFTRWLSGQLTKLLSEGEGGEFWLTFFTDVLPWIFLITAAVLVISKSLGIELSSFLARKPAGSALPFREELKEDEDFGRLIEEALRQGDLRLAIRWYYLDALKQLASAGLIEWHPDKTNRQYSREIRDRELGRRFGQLTALFEYVWYGEFQPQTRHFEKARDDFGALKTLILREAK